MKKVLDYDASENEIYTELLCDKTYGDNTIYVAKELGGGWLLYVYSNDDELCELTFEEAKFLIETFGKTGIGK